MATNKDYKMRINTKTLHVDNSNNGWIIDYSTIQDIMNDAITHEPISMEQVECVVLAMVRLNYARLE